MSIDTYQRDAIAVSDVHTSTLYTCIQIYIYILYICHIHTHTHAHTQSLTQTNTRTNTRTHIRNTCMDTKYEENALAILVSRTGRAGAGGAGWAASKTRRSDSDMDPLEGGGASGVTGARALKLASCCKLVCMFPPPPTHPPSPHCVVQIC